MPGETTYPVPAARDARPQQAVSRAGAAAIRGRAPVRRPRAGAVQPAFALTERERGRRSPTSAGASTAFRSRSSSPRRACARLPVETIAERLGDRFRAADAAAIGPTLPRQQTLRALIDWSYDLLDASRAAHCFARLAVFAGGLTLEAAEAVGAGRRAIDASNVLDLLAALVEKSLVELDAERRPLPDARDRPPVRAGEARSRRREGPTCASGISTSISRSRRRRRRALGAGAGQVARAARSRARELARRARVVRPRARRRRARAAARLRAAALLAAARPAWSSATA